ncbi:hypothetical protein PAHAL_5G048500 [Panicum hallii]|jgi:hypothetical protein|uniref:Uncharacterized protein n=1 Tax=Panicum hallii TaxID=206008 RepID=A0A2S3HNU3_9POAL|nr:hypothetical protein PAHAL_5G048500 [Panicum hallii]
MDAVVKRGYGGYGYSKPQVNYHRQNTEYVTTVVTEVNHMTVNDKPSCGGAGVQKQAAYKEKEEVFVEHDKGSAYGGCHGGGAAVHKQSSYKEEEYEGAAAGVKKDAYYKQEKYGEAAGGYGAGAHYGGAAGVNKQGGYKQEACGETDAGHYGGGGAGAVQTYAYDHQAAYGGAIGAAVQQHGYQKDAYAGAAKKNSYKHESSYGECDAAKYGSHYGYGGGAYKHHEKYGEADGGYGGAYYSGAGVKYGYSFTQLLCMLPSDITPWVQNLRVTGVGGGKAAGGYPLHHGGAYGYEAHGKASKTGFAGGYHHNKAYDCESESDSDESDCEEAFPPRGPTKQGGVHGYGAAYKHEKHGAGAGYGYGTCSPLSYGA